VNTWWLAFAALLLVGLIALDETFRPSTHDEWLRGYSGSPYAMIAALLTLVSVVGCSRLFDKGLLP
jgi:hypothetical protein